MTASPAETPAPVEVSVVIPTYNRGPELRTAIRSVLAQRHGSFELIVVDQTTGPVDETQLLVKELNDDRLRYFHVSPPSLPAARNFGISRARGDIVLFVDDDVDLGPGFIAAHHREYADASVACVAGRVIGESSEPVGELFYMDRYGTKFGSYDYEHAADSWSARGCNVSYRREVLVQLGGFDTGFLRNALCEDLDMARTVAESGHRVRFAPDAVQQHFDAPTGGCREIGHTWNHASAYKNDLRFFYKHFHHRDVPGHLYMLFWRYAFLDRSAWNIIRRTVFLLVAPWRARRSLTRHRVIVQRETVRP